jgi:hypothetical protein
VEWAAREVEYIIRWVGSTFIRWEVSTSSGGWGVHHQVGGDWGVHHQTGGKYIVRWGEEYMGSTSSDGWGVTSSGGWGVHQQVGGKYIIRRVGSTSSGG